MIALTSSLQKPSTLYLFKVDDMPLKDIPAPEHQRQLQSCLRLLQIALLVSSKTQATYYLNTAAQIAKKLEIATKKSIALDSSRTTGWYLADQEKHIDVQATHIDQPLQCLVLNIAGSYQALLHSTTDINFTSQIAQTQRRGLLSCVHFLSRVLNSSMEIS